MLIEKRADGSINISSGDDTLNLIGLTHVIKEVITERLEIRNVFVHVDKADIKEVVLKDGAVLIIQNLTPNDLLTTVVGKSRLSVTNRGIDITT